MTGTMAPSARPGAAPADGARRAESILTVLGTVAMALMAGTFYGYAVSVMVGLHGTDDQSFVTAMYEINEVTPNAAFAPALLGALILPILAAIVAFRRRSRARVPIVAAAVLYLAAFVVTIAGNVPLNDDLEEAGPPERITDAHQVREDFEDPWVLWNDVRTVLTTAGLVALIVALRRGADPEP
jgi:uncharacterized membrane protein